MPPAPPQLLLLWLLLLPRPRASRSSLGPTRATTRTFQRARATVSGSGGDRAAGLLLRRGSSALAIFPAALRATRCSQVREGESSISNFTPHTSEGEERERKRVFQVAVARFFNSRTPKATSRSVPTVSSPPRPARLPRTMAASPVRSLALPRQMALRVCCVSCLISFWRFPSRRRGAAHDNLLSPPPPPRRQKRLRGLAPL